MAGLSEGSPAILWSIRITVNTSALQADDVGSIPIYSSISLRWQPPRGKGWATDAVASG